MFRSKYIIKILAVFIVTVGVYILYVLNIIPHKTYSNEDFGIKDYFSSMDKDGDGMDDQSDILQNVRNYIKKNQNTKVNITLPDIRTTVMVCVRMWWRRDFYMPAMT